MLFFLKKIFCHFYNSEYINTVYILRNVCGALLYFIIHRDTYLEITSVSTPI